MERKKILVVVDVQNDFVTGALRNEEAIKTVPNIVDKVKEYLANDDMVFFTHDTHDKDYMDTEEGKNLPIPHCIDDTEGWNLVPELEEIYEANISTNTNVKNFNKFSFGSVDFLEYLYDLNEFRLDSIEFIGFCTDICVISNALMAKSSLMYIPVYVDAACCAGVTPESHDIAIKAMSACHIHIENWGQEPWRK